MQDRTGRNVERRGVPHLSRASRHGEHILSSRSILETPIGRSLGNPTCLSWTYSFIRYLRNHPRLGAVSCVQRRQHTEACSDCLLKSTIYYTNTGIPRVRAYARRWMALCFAYYCSGHGKLHSPAFHFNSVMNCAGYGHATRVSAFASSLLKISNSISIHIVSSAPAHVFSDSIKAGAHYRSHSRYFPAARPNHFSAYFISSS